MKISGIYVVALVTAGISLLGMLLLPPVLPWMITPLDATESNIGFLMSAFTLPQIFVSPVIGVLTDRFGRKKILLPSLVIYSFTGMAIAIVNSLPIALVFRFCQGVVGAGFYPLSTTLIGDLYEGQERQQANGIMSAFVNVVGIITPAVAGYLALIDWRTPFLLFSSGIMVAALVWKVVPDRPTFQEANTLGSTESSWALFRQGLLLLRNWRLALTTFGSMMLFGVNMGCLLTFYPIFAQQVLGATQEMIGNAQAMAFAASTFTSVLYGRLSKHLRTPSIGILSFILYAVGVVLIPFSPSYLFSIGTVVFIGFGFGLAIPMLNNEMLEATPPEIRATESSIYQSMIRLGQTSSPILFGLLLATTGRLDLIFWIGAIIMVGVVCLYLIDYFKS